MAKFNIAGLVFIICIVMITKDDLFCNAGEDSYLSNIRQTTKTNGYLMPKNSEVNQRNGIFNVLDHGAKGDGKTDDTKAFLETWQATCNFTGSVMLVPAGCTFLLQPTTFSGNCQPNIILQVDGRIVAPSSVQAWQNPKYEWLLFSDIPQGLTIQGNGTIDGQGQPWWKSGLLYDDFDLETSKELKMEPEEESDYPKARRPHAIRILNSKNVTVTGIRIVNSPRMHLYVETCQYVKVYGFSVSSPGKSPNTDGIHLTNTQHVDIHNCTLACGDDCVSIQTGTSDVDINSVNCGPGHGFSIGGLGRNGSRATVSHIVVQNSKVTNSLTGVRIKTWPDCSGSVFNVTYDNIQMSAVKTPIVITQNYCDKSSPSYCNDNKPSNLAIYKALYKRITGTYKTQPVYLDCSPLKPCTDINMETINLSSIAWKPAAPYCSNVYGKLLTDTEPPLRNCLRSNATQGSVKSPALF